MKQYTYMMLKPDAFVDRKNEQALMMLKEKKLFVEKSQIVQVDMNVMKILLEHYHRVIDEKGKVFQFPAKLFNTFYFDGPHYIMPMLVCYQGDEDIISYSRKVVGQTNPQQADPQSIRGRLSQDSYDLADRQNRLVYNIIHASSSHQEAEKELKIWSYFLK